MPRPGEWFGGTGLWERLAEMLRRPPAGEGPLQEGSQGEKLGWQAGKWGLREPGQRPSCHIPVRPGLHLACPETERG